MDIDRQFSTLTTFLHTEKAPEKIIIKKCSEKNIAYEILFTSKDGNYDFLRDKIDKENITDIAICGGDGSIGPIVAATLNKVIHIDIIP